MTAIRRFRNLIVALALGSVGAAVAPIGAAYAGAGCSVDCVTSVTTNQYLKDKVKLYVDVQTGPATNVRIELRSGNQLVASTQDLAGSFTKIHHLSTDWVLDQGVQYSLRVSATDKSGRTHVEQSTVVAVRRTIVVKVTQVKVTEDSDTGAGELSAGMRLGATTATVFGTRSLTSPHTSPLNWSMTATNVPASAKLYAEMLDDDVDFGEWCPAGTAWSFTSGSTNCFDWATGSTALFGLGQGVGTTQGSFSVGAAGSVGFVLSGTYVATVG